MGTCLSQTVISHLNDIHSFIYFNKTLLHQIRSMHIYQTPLVIKQYLAVQAS
jgi:hypothetical protein